MNETLFPIKQAAERLGISIWTLRKKCYERNIDSIKIGVKLLIPESELERLVREGMRPRRAVDLGDDQLRPSTPKERK